MGAAVLAAPRRVERWRRRVGGVERACACAKGSNRTARRMAVLCEVLGLGAPPPNPLKLSQSDPPS